MKALIAILAALALTGCASAPYDKYSEMHIAYAAAQTAKYNAIGVAAASADTTIGVASMFALMAAGGGNGVPQIAAPKSTSDYLREWAGILVPGLVQGYGMYSNTRLGMTQSDNSTALGISTNDTMRDMAGFVQAPAPNMTIGGSGVIGSGSYSTDTHATYDSYNPVDNSQQPIDNSNQGNPVASAQAGNPQP